MKEHLKTLNTATIDMRMAMLNGDWAEALRFARDIETAATAVRHCLEECIEDETTNHENGQPAVLQPRDSYVADGRG